MCRELRVFIALIIAAVVAPFAMIAMLTSANPEPSVEARLETRREQMICAEAFGNSRGFEVARYEFNTLARRVGVEENAAKFGEMPNDVAHAIFQMVRDGNRCQDYIRGIH